MKKTILALAVASTAVAAQADNTTLYGDVTGSYTYSKVASAKAVSKFESTGKVGIKGSDDLGNGLSAVYKIQTSINDEDNSGKRYVGLKGEFGEVTVGLQSLPADLGNNSDPFNATTPEGKVNFTAAQKAKLPSFSNNKNNSLVYKSNDMSGFTVGAAVVANGAAQEKHTDAYQLMAQYDANGIFAGLSYTASKSGEAKKKELGLGLGYAADQFSVGLEAGQTKYKNAAGATAKETKVRLAGTYNIDDANSVYAGYAMTKVKSGDTKTKGKGYAAGFEHKFSKRTKAWAEFGVEKAGTFGSDDHVKTKTLSLGLKTKF